MNDYAPFPSSSTLITSNRDSKSLSLSLDDTETEIKPLNYDPSIDTKLKHLDLNGIITTNNRPHFVHQKQNSPLELIERNKNGNVFFFTENGLAQTAAPETPAVCASPPPSKPSLKSQSLPQLAQIDEKSSVNNVTSSMSLCNLETFDHETPSICTNDPGAPIISLDKAKREFKTVSGAALRFQFVCETYRRCKLGTVKEKDFAKLEDVINYVHDQLLKKEWSNSSNNIADIKDMIRPPLCAISKPKCILCNKSFASSNCYTTCNHPLCIKCLVNTFNNTPRDPRWYQCPVNGCYAMLPPQSHFLVLSFKPSLPKKSNHLKVDNMKNKMLHKTMVSEYIKMRNISYKNMLKILGEYFSSKLKYYQRWRKCENCDFGFLADPDVSWYQVFELKCVVCSVVQRVQLLGPEPCNKLSIKKSYYPNDNMFKTLVFIRHGEAQNNINPNDPNLRDPNLTNRGKQQCKHLHKYFGSMINVECILSSSMNRCIQTSIIGVYQKNVPFIALECLRERLCPMFNRRENISVKKEKYKGFGIDFSECKIDDDMYFDKENKNEQYENMNKRAWQFYWYLLKRSEQRIVIVSHEGMLQCLMNVIDSNDKCLRRSFKNAEARLCFLTRRK